MIKYKIIDTRGHAFPLNSIVVRGAQEPNFNCHVYAFQLEHATGARDLSQYIDMKHVKELKHEKQTPSKTQRFTKSGAN